VSTTATKKQPFAAASFFRKSPLTDSNRRPPPYHGGFEPLWHLGESTARPALSLQARSFSGLVHPFFEEP
jgi:hypothetical protein